jgi:crotonobetainyl-CoA:carnitine CoA-transferase CaiB-like acyl-CoA transferase
MLQTVTREDSVRIAATRAPPRVDEARPTSDRAATKIGAQTAAIKTEFGL